MNTNKKDVLLQVKDLRTVFESDYGPLAAVDGADFELRHGEVLGVVGESGSGKTQLCMSIMRLIAEGGRIESGEIIFKGRNLLEISAQEMRRIRGSEISMIFQEPGSSFDPVYTVGNHITETLHMHQAISRTAAHERSIELLKEVGIARPEAIVDEYPQRLSGGMCQRVMIAIALSCAPKLLIADEPTTALDVTIQAQVLELMKKLQKEHHTAILFITHDLGVIAEMARQVVVMYAGEIVEKADAVKLFAEPRHPYTRALIRSRPRSTEKTVGKLPSIRGNVPNLSSKPPGCPFHPRCTEAMEVCRHKKPPRHLFRSGQEVRCWLHEAKAAQCFSCGDREGLV